MGLVIRRACEFPRSEGPASSPDPQGLRVLGMQRGCESPDPEGLRVPPIRRACLSRDRQGLRGESPDPEGLWVPRSDSGSRGARASPADREGLRIPGDPEEKTKRRK